MALVAALFGSAIGALLGGFAWSLLGTICGAALTYIARNFLLFAGHASSGNPTTRTADVNGALLDSPSDWLEKWNEEMDYCPTYEGTPGNIWRRPKWTTED